jgi:hypothetical protein
VLIAPVGGLQLFWQAGPRRSPGGRRVRHPDNAQLGDRAGTQGVAKEAPDAFDLPALCAGDKYIDDFTIARSPRGSRRSSASRSTLRIIRGAARAWWRHNRIVNRSAGEHRNLAGLDWGTLER